MGNRKEAEAYILKYIDAILPDGKNKAIYQEKFKQLDDAAFAKWMEQLANGEDVLNLVAPNGNPVKLDVKRNLDIAKEIGHEFFQRYWTRLPDGSGWYLSNEKYLVIEIPVRRQAQLLVKKISFAEHNRSVDDLTGQASGKSSKSSKVSYPEIQMLAAMGLEKTLSELIKYRGGDEKGMAAMDASISRTGGVSLKAIEPYAGTVRASQTLSAYLTGMHLSNNLIPR